jgi:hypothetical protein
VAELTREEKMDARIAFVDRPLRELIADARRFGFSPSYYEMCRLADAAERGLTLAKPDAEEEPHHGE